MGLHQSSGSSLCACDIPATRGLCHLKRVLEINESGCVERGGRKEKSPRCLAESEGDREGSESHRCLVRMGERERERVPQV